MKFSEVKSERLWTPKEVAELLGVTPSTVRDWIFQKKIHAFRVGGRYRIPESALNFDSTMEQEFQPEEETVANIRRTAEIEASRRRIAEKFGI